MKKFVAAAFALAMLSFVSSSALAKEATIKGEAKCGKCSLKESSTCETVIQAKENGKTVNYYVANNKLAKAFHKKVCSSSEKVIATGDVKDVDGKKQITLTKIEVAEK